MKEIAKGNAENTTIILDKMAYETLGKIHFCFFTEPKYKVDNMIFTLDQCLQETKNEVFNRFNYDEILYMLSVHVRTVYDPFTSMKFQLKLKIMREYIHNFSSETIEEIDIEILERKLDRLTEFQAFTLIHMIMEFHNHHKSPYSKSDVLQAFNTK